MAQLVAHHTGSVGVRGSSPLSSTHFDGYWFTPRRRRAILTRSSGERRVTNFDPHRYPNESIGRHGYLHACDTVLFAVIRLRVRGGRILIIGVYVKSLGRLVTAIFAGIGFYSGALIVGAPAGAFPMAPLPSGGPVCAGGVIAQTAGDGGVPAGVAGAAGAAGALPCAADVTTLAGPVPMGLPGPVPPIPIAPIPVVPGLPPPVPLVAPGPAGAAAASPIAGLATDAISAPIGLAGGTK